MKPMACALLCMVLMTAASCKPADAQPIPTQAPTQVMTAAPENTTTVAPVISTQLPEITPIKSTNGHEVRVVFINVGKGDAALVQMDGKNYLIDTGTAESTPAFFGALNLCGVQKLDAVFLTHTHSDHIGGMELLGQNYAVDQIYAGFYSENKKDGTNKITTLAEQLSLPLTRLTAGEMIPLNGDVCFEVLGPRTLCNDDNDNSLVLRLVVNETVLLFAGDMQFEEEQLLLDAGANLASDVLKVGNHGNPDATGDGFAKQVHPKIAVISTDTKVDTDSANPRVIAALGDAQILTTQDYTRGILLTIPAHGEMPVAQALAEKPADLQLSILSVDLETQMATIRNDGQTADLSGCILLSERGGEAFRFPSGSVVASGKTVTVSGAGGGGDYTFIGEKKPWSKKKTDTALLYDQYGNKLAEKF